MLNIFDHIYGRKFTLITDHKSLLWFKNAQDANMRILRWRLKLAEYNYNVIYKAGKTNINADALSRNSVNLEEVNCKPINPNRSLNLDNPEDVEMVSRMLEETDEEEEDENFELYLSDNEEDEGQMLDNNLSDENTNNTIYTRRTV